MTTTDVRPEGKPDNLADNDQKPCGYGRMLRKEDPRFIRGRGNYVDDVALPGMLHLAILRSPYAHARIVGIDTTAAQAHPKVKAVVTGADLAAKGLAWMPTLSNDVQAVLATDKVRFQGQEVAFVVAEDHYAAARCGQAVLATLQLTEAQRRRVHTPVGLPIGAKTPAEIAVSILAEVIRGIRVDGLVATTAAGPAEPR